MSSYFSRLTKLLFELESVGGNVYRSILIPGSQPLWQGTRRGLFGGQVAAQCLSAAYKTVPEDRLCHSFHSYFISLGDQALPVYYHVRQIRDGRSYTSRMIEGVQKDKTIFSMIASFSKPEADIVHITQPMPKTLQPEDLDLMGFLAALIANEDLSPNLRKAVKQRVEQFTHVPVELQPTDPLVYFRVRPSDEPTVHSWVRFREAQETKAQLSSQQSHILTTYLADMGILVAGLSSVRLHKAFVTSLDHSVYFHEPMLSPSDYLLSESHCLYGGRGRTSNKGNLWRRDGSLVATIFQEGLVRMQRPTEKERASGAA
uniref:Acyl-CoA thioesterase II n=1 Tax=Macrostomum lignano TaxID=282301 RepID=A0A1I8GRI2_9PLAT